MGETENSRRGFCRGEAKKKSWDSSQVFNLLEAVFGCSLTRTVNRSKREKEEETTRTVVVRRRYQSDSDEGGNKIAFWF